MATAYAKGALVHVPGESTSEFVVTHSTGDGLGFNAEQLRHFVASNGFRERLAKALYALAAGDAVVISAARQRLVVSRPRGKTATIRRRFKLTRDLP